MATKKSNEHKTIAIYARVSTDLQAQKEEGSLETQEARLRAHFEARGVDPDVWVFREEGKSGKSLDRPELQRLLAEVRAGRVETVAVTRIDRISRSLRDFLELQAEFEALGVQLVSLKESFDTSTSFGRAMLKLLLVFAELEREQIGERTRDSMRARAERGLWNGGAPPMGYVSDGHGHLSVDAREASVVILIFEKFVELASTPKLERWLNERGYRQKTYESRRRGRKGGNPFNKAGLLRILRNRLYIGEITHLEEVHEGQHEGIIERDLFLEAQEILNRNGANQRKPRPKRAVHNYLLTGLMRCPCGSSLTTSRGKNYPYYRCSRHSKEQAHYCPVKQVRAERTEAAVLDIIREASLAPSLVQAAVVEANAMLRDNVSPLVERLQEMKRELRRVDEEGRTLYHRLKHAGIDSLPWAKADLQELADRRRQLKHGIEQAEREVAIQESQKVDASVLLEAVQGVAGAWDDLDAEERKELMWLLVREVRVSKDKRSVEVDLYQGLSVVAGMRRHGVLQDVNSPGHKVCDRGYLAPEAGLERTRSKHGSARDGWSGGGGLAWC